MRRFLSNKAILPLSSSLAAAFFLIPLVADAAWFEIGYGALTRMILLPLELLTLPLAAGIMALSGMIMDSAIGFSLNTAYIFSLSPAINLGWVIVRDIANIFFIFVLIVISLGTIVRGLSFGTMRMLKQVVIAALLINFSLFATKAVIDVSNIFGNWLYGGIQKTLQVNSASSRADQQASLSGLIATRLGIVNWWAPNSIATANADGGAPGLGTGLTDPTKSFIGVFLRLIIVFVTTYIFLYCAVLFIARSVTVLFLMVFSPVGFMGEVLPQLSTYSQEWRKELTNAAIFPIAFLLLLYISLQFINSLGALNMAAVTGNNPVKLFGLEINVAQYFQYFLVIFLLQATLKIAKKYSGAIGESLSGIAKQIGQLAIGLSTGAAGFVGRSIIGGAAAQLATNGTLNDMAAGKTGGNRFTKFTNQMVGKAALGAARGTAKSSFDVRGVSAVTGLAKSAGIDMGKAGGKDGYKGMVKALEKKEADYAKEFGDTPEGISRRMAYAENRKSSLLNSFQVGEKAAGKIGEKVESEAMAASTKGATEKARKDAQKVKNQMVHENMGAESIHNAVKNAVDPRDAKNINRALEAEKARLATMSERARAKKDNPTEERKNKLAYNRYAAEQQEKILEKADATVDEVNAATRETIRLNQEYAAATAIMTTKELEEINKAATDIKDMENSNEAYIKEIDKVLKVTDFVGKKRAADELTTHIKDKRIGKPSQKFQKGKDGNPDQPAVEATGLIKKLEEAKKKVADATKEQNAILGRDKGGGDRGDKGGGDGGGGGKKDEGGGEKGDGK